VTDFKGGSGSSSAPATEAKKDGKEGTTDTKTESSASTSPSTDAKSSTSTD